MNDLQQALVSGVTNGVLVAKLKGRVLEASEHQWLVEGYIDGAEEIVYTVPS